jgi:chromosomal replication initiator protein
VDGIADIPLSGQSLTPGPHADRSRPRRWRLDGFVAGPENWLAVEAVHNVLDRPGRYNPLLLYGESGTGKTHMARGLAAAWKASRGAGVEYVTAVAFARELADSVETQTLEHFRSKYRGAELLVIEDLGRETKRRSMQTENYQELIVTLDAAIASGRQVVATARTAPSLCSELPPALQSRLTQGLSVALLRPRPETRRELLDRLAAVQGVELTPAAAALLADGLDATVPELHAALSEIETSDERRIDAEAARHYLRDSNRLRQPPLAEIASAVARYFSLKVADLKSSSRRRAVVSARNVAFYLGRHVSGTTFQQVGHFFGNRDHTTVMHGCRKVETLLESDPAMREVVAQLRAQWRRT